MSIMLVVVLSYDLILHKIHKHQDLIYHKYALYILVEFEFYCASPLYVFMYWRRCTIRQWRYDNTTITLRQYDDDGTIIPDDNRTRRRRNINYCIAVAVAVCCSLVVIRLYVRSFVLCSFVSLFGIVVVVLMKTLSEHPSAYLFLSRQND